MENQSLKNKIISEAKVDNSWLESAKKRQSNKHWLDLSFKIALKILRYLRDNNISQKELASRLECSPQYLSKILKGKENLTLETICKIQKVIGISLIQVPIIINEVELLYNSKDIMPTKPLREIKESMSTIKNEEKYSKNKEGVANQIHEEYLVAA